MKLLIFGATGLVGGQVLELALSNPHIEKIIAPTRHALPIKRPKLFNPVIDFEHLPKDAEWWQVDAVICCLGTTIKKAGSKENFKHVDYGYTLEIAKIARAHGVKSYILNSALGANPNSPFFYSRIKGQTEKALQSLNFASLTFVRPALIEGERLEKRFAETLGIFLVKKISSFLPKKYRLNPASNIAKKLLQAALYPQKNIHVISSEEMI